MAIDGSDPQAVTRSVMALVRTLSRAGARGVRAGARVLDRGIKRELSKPGHGRTYPRGKRRTHQASAPGEPPAVDHGRLRSSVHHEPVADATYHVGPDALYAEPLEYGTAHMAPRPFMRPALEGSRAEMATAFVADAGAALDVTMEGRSGGRR